MRGVYTLCLVLLPVWAFADTADKPQVPTSSSVTAQTDVSVLSNWPIVILTLLFIVLMIVFLGWLARRMSGFGATGGQTMKVLSAIPVGTRERIALIDIQGQQLVVGVTQHNINLLHRFDEPVVSPPKQDGSDFSKKLADLISSPDGGEK